jgi:hypothetical protein
MEKIQRQLCFFWGKNSMENKIYSTIICGQKLFLLPLQRIIFYFPLFPLGDSGFFLLQRNPSPAIIPFCITFFTIFATHIILFPAASSWRQRVFSFTRKSPAIV